MLLVGRVGGHFPGGIGESGVEGVVEVSGSGL